MEKKFGNNKFESKAKNRKDGKWFLNRLPGKNAKYLWYVYGCGNAERLCKIVNDVVNEYKNEIGDDENKKFLFWHMVLLDILNIKISDLKLDFEKEKSESVGEAIKNCLLTKEAVKRRNDFINGFIYKNKDTIEIDNNYFASELYKYSKKIFPEFAQIKYSDQYELHPDKTATEYKFLSKVFSCFLKVSFYRMESVSELKQNKKYREKINAFWFDFYEGNLYSGSINSNIEDMAIYLFKTGELNNWARIYNYDLFKYFCRVPAEDCCKYFDFSSFVFFLDKEEPLKTRYYRNPKEFWKIFFPDKLDKFIEDLGDPLHSTDHLDVLKYVFDCITAYFSDCDSVLREQISEDIEKMLKDAKIDIKKIQQDQNWPSDFFKRDLFNPDRKKFISDCDQKNYFNPVITRFYGQKDLKENVIQSISEVIKDKNGVEHEDETKTKLASNPVQNNQIDHNEINFVTDKIAHSISEIIEDKEDKDETVQINYVYEKVIRHANHSKDGKNHVQESKVGFCQHCLFGLFFILMCFSLFLCFKISLYFLVLFFIFLIICSCLGFKNYCSRCRCSKNIETPLIDDDKDISSKSQSVDNDLIKLKSEENRIV